MLSFFLTYSSIKSQSLHLVVMEKLWAFISDKLGFKYGFLPWCKASSFLLAFHFLVGEPQLTLSAAAEVRLIVVTTEKENQNYGK